MNSVMELRNNGLGRASAMRVGLVIAISALVWLSEASLVLWLKLFPPSRELSVAAYNMPVAHLLPWAFGLLALRRIKKAVGKGTMPASGANLAYDLVLSLLLIAYVALGGAEFMGVQALRLAASHCQ